MKILQRISILFFIFGFCLAACGSSPSYGQYKGTNPNVSFTLTSSGVVAFVVMLDQCNGINGLSTGTLERDGTFTILEQSPGDTEPSVLITGKITGNTATGTYQATRIADFCDNVSGFGSRISGTWSAKLVGSNE
jgi:hypothetical protein